MVPDEPEVSDSRRTTRYTAIAPIKGNFGSADVWVHDLGERGFQVQHIVPLKLANAGVLTFAHPRTSETLVFRVRVVWSRLSSMQAANGKFLYRSGLRVEQLDDASRNALETLFKEFASPDSDSLSRKRRKLSELASRRAHGAASRSQSTRLPPNSEPSIPKEHVLLVKEARSRLRGDVVESMRWYNRAKTTLTDADLNFLNRERIHHREDVLAVWEFLQRKVPLQNVVKVFEQS